LAIALRRVLLIAKRSAYDLYVRQHGSQRVKDLLARKDPTVARMMRADEHHGRTLEEVQIALDALGVRFNLRMRDRVGEVTDVDLVITVGGDGTLLSVSHSVGSIPMLGVNSAPMDSVGYLCSARMGGVRAHLEAALAGRVRAITLARMAVRVDGVVQHARVLNDALFAHAHPANTSRYLLTVGDHTEEQRSSGIWVSTATGSTAAIHSAGGRVLPLRSRKLQYVVREPYAAPGERALCLGGVLRQGQVFEVANKMREAKVYLDGPRTALTVEIGQRVRFERSDEPLMLLGVSAAGSSARR
jgi:NAD+ kinase